MRTTSYFLPQKLREIGKAAWGIALALIGKFILCVGLYWVRTYLTLSEATECNADFHTFAAEAVRNNGTIINEL